MGFSIVKRIYLPLAEGACVIRMKEHEYFGKFSVSIEDIVGRIVGYVD